MFAGKTQRVEVLNGLPEVSFLQDQSFEEHRREVKLNEKTTRKKSLLAETQALPIPSALTEAIADVRSNASATDYAQVLAQYGESA